MIFKNLHVLRATIASLLLFTLSSCASLGGGLPSAVVNALTQVTGFSTSITDWQSSLGGMLDDSGLSKLKDFAGQAGDLGSTVSGLTETVSGAMQDPLGAIGDQLTSMAGIDVDGLTGMAPEKQMDAVNGFTDSAKGLGEMTSSFLEQFGG